MALDDPVLARPAAPAGPNVIGADVRSIFSQLHPAAALPRRIALVGTFTPRKCGIATFGQDVVDKLAEFHPHIGVEVYALDEPRQPLAYEGVAGVVRSDDPESYAAAARRINESGVDAVWLQHEYGIFGGADGEMACDFVDRLAAPLILTAHTVLAEPNERQRTILQHLVTRASRIMVMSRHAHDLLAAHYGAPREILQIVPHGAPDRPFGRAGAFKQSMGLAGKNVLMTFGLLGPGKGLERVIEALPAIVARHPETVYRIVGATHPNLLAREGEAYRERLQALADALGVADHIAWDNRFLDTDELLDQLEACDIYLTPYFNLQQSTSGTLSYAVALGKAVVSTPYVHARELLAGDTGRLIEPDSAAAIAAEVNALLDDEAELTALQRRAYAKGRQTIWPRFADGAAALIEAAIAPPARGVPLTATPGLTGVFAMSDTTGMFQHAIGIMPDRRHGYCLDDNARALMLMNVAAGLGDEERARWSLTYAAFVQHAWNEEAQGFRNFMNFDRSWCEHCGSEDSNGRTLWALGHTLEQAPDAGLRDWARRWFDMALPRCADLVSPRTIAFTMLGYDNPRLPQALIEAGLALDDLAAIEAGLETLEWIAAQQHSVRGHFRPIGSESFGRAHTYLPFDQQPLEAQAAIDASRAAFAATDDERWFEHAEAAWNWFFGANDRGVVLADLATGRSRDGINRRGANENCGAESILAFQLAHYSMLALARARQRDSSGEHGGRRRTLAE